MGGSSADIEALLVDVTNPDNPMPGMLPAIFRDIVGRLDAAGRACRDRGSRRAALVLPAYSPDFNPIEMAFSKLKALLRKAAERTVEGLWSAIGRLVDTVTPYEAICKAWSAEPGRFRSNPLHQMPGPNI